MKRNPSIDATIRDLHAVGMLDPEIGEWTGICSRTVLMRRKALGLKGHTPRGEMKRIGFRRQMATLGVATLAEMRRRKRSAAVESQGWPAGLALVHGKILDVLESGEKSTAEINAALGRKPSSSVSSHGRKSAMKPLEKLGYIASRFIGPKKFWRLTIQRRLILSPAKKASE